MRPGIALPNLGESREYLCWVSANGAKTDTFRVGGWRGLGYVPVGSAGRFQACTLDDLQPCWWNEGLDANIVAFQEVENAAVGWRVFSVAGIQGGLRTSLRERA